jgi:hypothetical protein
MKCLRYVRIDKEIDNAILQKKTLDIGFSHTSLYPFDAAGVLTGSKKRETLEEW